MASASITSSGAYPMMLAGHSGRLKYAEARDLPSYPSPGLRPGDAAASAAATRGWASTPVSPTFQNQNQPSTPRLSQDALLAAGWAQRQKQSSLPAPSSWGSTAANLAFKAGQTAPPATAESPELSRQNSMHAAKGAMGGLRPRARSSPQAPVEEEDATYADRSTTAGTHALSAATIAHRPSMRAPASPVSSAGDAGAIPFTTMNRQMFTSHPPVKPETDEKNRADVLHASALAMAKKMYDHQQRIIDNSARAASQSAAHSTMSEEQQQPPPMIYTSLQEAAYRQAQERLAKLQQEHDQQRSLQEYYNTSPTSTTTTPYPQRSKLGTLKGKLTRRRSSSDSDLQRLEDRRRSEQIRQQMTLLNTRLGAVDEDKRARDRAALLAAAQRNVRARMAEMDEKNAQQLLQHGGAKVGGMDDWGRKALVAAQARFDAGGGGGGYRNAGKVDIGGGKMMERSEVERIAAAKVQPLLDEINERAEKEQTRLEEERLDAERRKEEAERERAREREVEEIHRQLKEQQKEDERARKAEIKQEEKLRKEEAKAIKAEQKQAAKEEKHKDKETAPPPPATTTTTGEAEESTDTAAAQERERKRLSGMRVRHVRALSLNFPKRPARTPKGKDKDAAAGPAEAHPSADDNATSPTRKVRAWLLSRFPRPRAKSAAVEGTTEEQHDVAHDNSNTNTNGNGTGTERGFIGGVALARLQGKNRSASSVEGLPHPVIQQQQEMAAQRSGQDLSMREVAMAGRQSLPPLPPPPPNTSDEPGESSASAAAAFADPTTPPTTTTTAATDYATSTVPVTTTVAPRTPSPRNPNTGTATAPRPASQVSAASVPLSVSERSVSSLSSGGLNSDEEEEEGHFVMARSGQSPEPAMASLSPPQSLSQPRVMGGGGMAMAGRVSPFRESRFSEILE